MEDRIKKLEERISKLEERITKDEKRHKEKINEMISEFSKLLSGGKINGNNIMSL